MNVLLNGTPIEVSEQADLASVVETIARDRRGVAAAVNGEVVPRSLWATVELSANDRVEVLSAIGGG